MSQQSEQLGRLEEEAVRLRGLIERESQALEDLQEEERVEVDDVDGHVGDRAPQLTYREQERAIVRELMGQLEQVEAAMRRVDDGGYGVCEVCGAEIDAERLEARPTAVRCRAHA